MRFADIAWRACVLGVVAAGGTGCALTSAPMNGVRQVIVPAPIIAATTPLAAKVAALPDAPVSPAALRAFDDASRALRAGRTDEAERGFRALAQSNPELGGVHANLGVIQRAAGKLPEAVSAFELAVHLNPNQPVYQNQLGVSYRQQGRFDKAREAYERAIALDVSYAAPVLNLGILYDLYLGDGPRALELYDRYLALSPPGDAVVTRWVAELKNRKAAPITVSRKEKS